MGILLVLIIKAICLPNALHNAYGVQKSCREGKGKFISVMQSIRVGLLPDGVAPDDVY